MSCPAHTSATETHQMTASRPSQPSKPAPRRAWQAWPWCCLVSLVVCLSWNPAPASEPAYDWWAGGAPEEALPQLLQIAQDEGTWHRWLDAGLAARDAEVPGLAIACLVAAVRAAPERSEATRLLAALGVTIERPYHDRLWPLHWLGRSPVGLILALLAAAGLGWALAAPRHRRLGLWALPGLLPLLAASLIEQADGSERLLATTQDSRLVDGAGSTLSPLPAGSLLRRLDSEPWAGRLLVDTMHGQRGWVAIGDLAAALDGRHDGPEPLLK